MAQNKVKTTPTKWDVEKAMFRRSWRKNRTLYLMLLLPIIYFIVFKYVPMVGNVIAFRRFVPGKSMFGESWEGFKYFEMFLFDKTFWKLFKNTIVISLTTLAFAFPLPILFALLLNELSNGIYKKIVQTITIIPRFLSVVVVIGMFSTILSPSAGIVNKVIEALGGAAVYFWGEPEWFKPIYVSTEVWQFMGWNSIIYMAVLAGADMEQYEAAKVDGANRFQQAWYITIPLMLPTIALNFIMAIAGVLNVGFEKIIYMYTGTTIESADVIQSFVYRVGLQGGNFSYGTAISLFQGLFGLVLLFFANKIVNKYWDAGLF